MEKNKLNTIEEDLNKTFGEDGADLLFLYKGLTKIQETKFNDELIIDLYDLYLHITTIKKSYTLYDFLKEIKEIKTMLNEDIRNIDFNNVITATKEGI